MRLDVLENGTLYRAKWPPDVESVGQAYLQTGATIIEMKGRHNQWHLRMRFDTQEDLSTFNDYCNDQEIPIEVTRIYKPTTPKGGGQFGVTPKQREALVAALQAGFYDIPQDATMKSVADTLGISQQALSKRLRRAHGNLVSNVLTIEELSDDA